MDVRRTDALSVGRISDLLPARISHVRSPARGELLIQPYCTTLRAHLVHLNILLEQTSVKVTNFRH